MTDYAECAECRAGEHSLCDGYASDGWRSAYCECARDRHENYPDAGAEADDGRDYEPDDDPDDGEAPDAVHDAYERLFGW